MYGVASLSIIPFADNLSELSCNIPILNVNIK